MTEGRAGASTQDFPARAATKSTAASGCTRSTRWRSRITPAPAPCLPCGTGRGRPSSATNPPRSSACSTAPSTAWARSRATTIRRRCAATQGAYDEAVEKVFAGLDTLERRLAGQRYLVGNTLTEADWRLFPTLVRFDAAYHHVFKCTWRPLASYVNLQNYMLELYQVPGVAETVKLDHIVTGYYSIERVNPNRIVPKIPKLDWTRPHNRPRLDKALSAA